MKAIFLFAMHQKSMSSSATISLRWSIVKVYSAYPCFSTPFSGLPGETWKSLMSKFSLMVVWTRFARVGTWSGSQEF